ncbi:MAG: TRAP transporter small permease subunit [Magnetospiraceae bacterium]
MPGFIKAYVRIVDKVNHRIGRMTLYVIFVMIGVLFWSSIAKTFFTPSLWTVEFSQFLMVGYFLIGGAYSIQQDAHVRMDLVYGMWRPRTKSRWDALTDLVMIGFLIMLLYGAVDSTLYAIEYGERSYSIWRPYMWPIKIIMTLGIFLMLLQAISQFFKDLAYALGKPLP